MLTARAYSGMCAAFSAWLEENYKKNVVLDDFVATTDISRRHVQRALAHGKVSWRDALIDRRMEEGARLLRANPTMTVSRVAEEVGYSQPAQFSRTFRERMGKSPLDYRNGGE